ncbi:hypothetical protein ACLB1S_22230 [Escherichia coli]
MNNFEKERRKALRFMRGVYRNLIDAARQRGNEAVKLLNKRLKEINVQKQNAYADRYEADRAARTKIQEKPEQKIARLLNRVEGIKNKREW